ncbi:hypothetical protein MMC27_007574 [Xylographa pallens]|nr:hypothetical protein [Xylographa pallens]
MLKLVVSVVTLYLVFKLYLQVVSLRKNIAEAKSTGFTYVVLYVHLLSLPWALLQPLLLPLLVRLPDSLTATWLPLLLFTKGWHYGYQPFEKVGSDTFIVVSPGGNILHTCDPELSAYFLRSNTFGKPAELLNLLNIFGPTMTGTDGHETRLYRKIAAPFFTEQTLEEVWTRSVSDADTLFQVLQPGDDELRPVLAKMTLHILNAVCFEDKSDLSKELQQSQVQPPPDHELSYSQAIHGVLDTFKTIFLLPKVILGTEQYPVTKFFPFCAKSLEGISPFESHKKAGQAYRELRKYMVELKNRKEATIQDANSGVKPSLLDILVQAGKPTKTNPTPLFSPEAVIGNMFIFMFAGHEANANTFTFLIYLLACNPHIQTLLQQDIDRITSKDIKDASTIPTTTIKPSWSYEKCYPELMDSYVGAVIYETLRLFTVLPFLPKRTLPGSPTPLPDFGRFEDRKQKEAGQQQQQRTLHILPPNLLILINTTAAHLHPRHWALSSVASPSLQPSGHGPGLRPSPLVAFDPARWLRGGGDGEETQEKVEDINSQDWSTPDDSSAPTAGSPTAPHRLRPKPGTFIPFSDGARGCLGRKFALVEMCAVVSRIFSEWSVELVVAAEKEDDESEEMVRREGERVAWKDARRRAEKALLNDVEFDMSLRLRGKIPIRFVSRGCERWSNMQA